MVGKGSSRFVFLLSMLLLILLIQILPQVDLPATAFRRNSEPLAIHATLVSSPLVLISTSAMHAVLPDLRGMLHSFSTSACLASADFRQPVYQLRC